MLLGTQSSASHPETPHPAITILTYLSRKDAMLSKRESQLTKRHLNVSFALIIVGRPFLKADLKVRVPFLLKGTPAFA